MKKALIIGFGISGRSAAHFLLSQGVEVVAVDKKAESLRLEKPAAGLIERGVKLVSDLQEFSGITLAILSPGIEETHPLVAKLKALNIPLSYEIQLGIDALKNERVIGITGTNGKTTVTLLVEHVLNFAGKKAVALGNVGIPLAEQTFNLKGDEIIVLELSSYQLETLQCKALDAAVCLNVTPDHLDRYKEMEIYAKTKALIGNCLKSGGKFFVEESAMRSFKAVFNSFSPLIYGYGEDSNYHTDGKKLFHMDKELGLLPESLMGKKNHDVENMMAAVALCGAYGVSFEEFKAAYASFKKPHHRIEFVKELEGIRFYDDSKGTNIDAVLRALESMEGKTVLIAGGVDKGAPYTPWIEPFKCSVKAVFAIGEAKEKILEDLKGHVPVFKSETLESAVQEAFKCAQKGENVLLSPGCSSFDMFKDYVQRGLEFQKLVHTIRS